MTMFLVLKTIVFVCSMHNIEWTLMGPATPRDLIGKATL